MAEFTPLTDVAANGQAVHQGGTVIVAACMEVQDYLETALGALGYRVKLVDDGEQLLDLWTAIPDVVAVLCEQRFVSGLSDVRNANHRAGIGGPIGLISMDGGGGIPAEWTADGVVLLPEPIFHVDLKCAMGVLKETGRGRSEAANPVPVPSRSTRHSALVPESLSPQMRRISRVIEQAARCDVPVLVQGETGVGKETVVRAIHERSARARQPFVIVNCAALPKELVESQLFGYERGAFTGAHRNQPGLFEAADGGTIFLDEIGDMDIRLQAKLLQVLQDQEFHPLGASTSIRVDVRVMAATHRDLRVAMANGQIREDLYYRLNVISIVLPPLRERREEILPLAEFLLKKHAAPHTSIPALDGELQALLLSHDWPGNVRELENMVRRYLVLRDHSVFDELRTREDTAYQARSVQVAETTMNGIAATSPGRSIFDSLNHAKNEAQIEALLAALAAAHWNRRKAADLLHVDYKSLLYQMKKFQIGAENSRSRKKSGSGSPDVIASGTPALAAG